MQNKLFPQTSARHKKETTTKPELTMDESRPLFPFVAICTRDEKTKRLVIEASHCCVERPSERDYLSFVTQKLADVEEVCPLYFECGNGRRLFLILLVLFSIF